MPVSRCARLKNDRRGAEPDSTALAISLSLSLSFSSCSSHHPRARSTVIPLPLATTSSFLPAPTFENRNPSSLPPLSPYRLPLELLLFLRFFFFLSSAFNSLLQDSLDSLGDYVSCYYSSRGKHPRVPSRPILMLLVFLLRCRCYSSSPAIDLLISSPRISSARDKTSSVSAAHFYEDEISP